MGKYTSISYNDNYIKIDELHLDLINQFIIQAIESKPASFYSNNISINLKEDIEDIVISGSWYGLVTYDLNDYILDEDDNASFNLLLNETENILKALPDIIPDTLIESFNLKKEEYDRWETPYAYPIYKSSLLNLINLIRKIVNNIPFELNHTMVTFKGWGGTDNIYEI